MAEVRQCPRCHALFNYNGLRDICATCAQKEEKLYDEVYRFLRRRENRAATVEQIEEQLGVDRQMLYDWVRKGRLQTAQFPGLGYPCDRCGALTQSGKVCEDCQKELENDLTRIQTIEEVRESLRESEHATYHRRGK